MQKKLTVFWLSLLITGGIDSIRNLPATAYLGSGILWFIMLGTVLFLVPAALISARLTVLWPTHSGIYEWVKTVFSKRLAFVAIWLQWINTMIWFPTILAFIAGTLSYLINPSLVDNKIYLAQIIIVSFWALTFLNMYGVQVSAKIASFCTIIGVVIPLILIIILGGYWVYLGKPSQIKFANMISFIDIFDLNNWISLTAVMASFLGVEIATVHVNNVQDPKRAFPRALFISVILILATLVFGSLAIAIVIPLKEITLISGVMQTFKIFLGYYNLTWTLPVITICIIVGSFGGMINWIISPAKGLLQATHDGLLPKILNTENKYGVPRNMLLLQATLVSIICLIVLNLPTINSFYWFLTSLSTSLYMVMYLIMYSVAIKSANLSDSSNNKHELILKNKYSLLITCCLGIMGCVVSILIAFIPPDNLIGTLTSNYSLTYGVSMMLIILLPYVIIYFIGVRKC